ncbi:MAG: THUMP domain-containing protein [candidate division KSB1 bacterium]|nr:THUMP domain-containing protein [candidate division KSB1 bacterium]
MMMFEYQQTQRFFAQIAGGLEPLGEEELARLGARQIELTFHGLYFEASLETLYRINYQSRFISRILAPLISFPCDNPQLLYNQARSVAWASLFSADQSFAIFANVSHSQITHSHYAALRVKDAIVDYFRMNFGRRPSIETIDPDVWIGLYIDHDMATISLDTSGGSLHRRGYRLASVEAPMQETVAAAIIHFADWVQAGRPLYDPMCGSGTLLSEALMAYCQVPAAFLRSRFGFEHLPDFEKNSWLAIKAEADRQIRPSPEGWIAGSDLSAQAIAAAKSNLQRLPDGNKIQLAITDFRHIEKLNNTIIVCNPPYGIRLGERKSLGSFYKSLGDFLKQRCRGSMAFIYFGNREWLKYIGLKPSWKKPLNNGGLDGRLAKFELY